MTSIVKQDLTQLIEQWLEAEANGIKFPVPFDLAWRIAGYSTKANALRLLRSKKSCLIEGEDYLVNKGVVLFIQSDESEFSGRSADEIVLGCDAFKHFCLLAQTEQGRQIRQYFIESEKKWRLVQKIDPALAQQVEIMRIQADIAKAQASMMADQRIIMEKSEAILGLHGPGMLALIQGRPDAIVEKVEKVTETIVCRDGRNVSFEGKSTAELGWEYGFKTGKQFEDWLIKQGHGHLVCQGMRAVQAPYVPTENLSSIKALWAKRQSRQLLIGE